MYLCNKQEYTDQPIMLDLTLLITYMLAGHLATCFCKCFQVKYVNDHGSIGKQTVLQIKWHTEVGSIICLSILKCWEFYNKHIWSISQLFLSQIQIMELSVCSRASCLSNSITPLPQQKCQVSVLEALRSLCSFC